MKNDSIKNAPSSTSTPILEEIVPLKDRLRKRNKKPEESKIETKPIEIISNEFVNVAPVVSNNNMMTTHYIVIPNNQFNGQFLTQTNSMEQLSYPILFTNDGNIQIENMEAPPYMRMMEEETVIVPDGIENTATNKIVEDIQTVQASTVEDKIVRATPKATRVNLHQKSLSTPSRKASHVRTLDFNTPLRLDMLRNLKANPRRLSEKLLLPESEVKKTEGQLMNDSIVDSRQEKTKELESVYETDECDLRIDMSSEKDDPILEKFDTKEAELKNTGKSTEDTLLEWQKMRTMASSHNFDQHLRQINSEMEKVVPKVSVPRTVKKKPKAVNPDKSPGLSKAAELLENALRSTKKEPTKKSEKKKTKKIPKKKQILIKLPNKTPRKESNEAIAPEADTETVLSNENVETIKIDGKKKIPCKSKIVKAKVKLIKKKEKSIPQIKKHTQLEEPQRPEITEPRPEQIEEAKSIVVLEAIDNKISPPLHTNTRSEFPEPYVPEVAYQTPAEPSLSHLKITADERTQSNSNFSLSGINLSTLLETPFKSDFLLCPQTPRFLIPSLDTPITRMLNDITTQSSFRKVCDIPTPNCAITPGAGTVNSPRSTGGYSNRPTDYSSSSSYYKPDESDEFEQRFEAMVQGERRKSLKGLGSTPETLAAVDSIIVKDNCETTVSTWNEESRGTVVEVQAKNSASNREVDVKLNCSASSSSSSSYLDTSSCSSSSQSDTSSCSSESEADEAPTPPNKMQIPMKSTLHLRMKTPKKPEVMEKQPSKKSSPAFEIVKKPPKLSPAALKRKLALAELEEKRNRTINILKNNNKPRVALSRNPKLTRKTLNRAEEDFLTKKQMAMRRDFHKLQKSPNYPSKRKLPSPKKVVKVQSEPAVQSTKPQIDKSNENALNPAIDISNVESIENIQKQIVENIVAGENTTTTLQQNLIQSGSDKIDSKLLQEILIRDLEDQVDSPKIIDVLKSTTETYVVKSIEKTTENVITEKSVISSDQTHMVPAELDVVCGPHRPTENIAALEATKETQLISSSEEQKYDDADEDDDDEEEFELITIDEQDIVRFKNVVYDGPEDFKDTPRVEFNTLTMKVHLENRIVHFTVSDEINIFEMRPRDIQQSSRRSKSIPPASSTEKNLDKSEDSHELKKLPTVSADLSKEREESSKEHKTKVLPAMVTIPGQNLAFTPQSNKPTVARRKSTYVPQQEKGKTSKVSSVRNSNKSEKNIRSILSSKPMISSKVNSLAKKSKKIISSNAETKSGPEEVKSQSATDERMKISSSKEDNNQRTRLDEQVANQNLPKAAEENDARDIIDPTHPVHPKLKILHGKGRDKRNCNWEKTAARKDSTGQIKCNKKPTKTVEKP